MQLDPRLAALVGARDGDRQGGEAGIGIEDRRAGGQGDAGGIAQAEPAIGQRAAGAEGAVLRIIRGRALDQRAAVGDAQDIRGEGRPGPGQGLGITRGIAADGEEARGDRIGDAAGRSRMAVTGKIEAGGGGAGELGGPVERRHGGRHGYSGRCECRRRRGEQEIATVAGHGESVLIMEFWQAAPGAEPL